MDLKRCEEEQIVRELPKIELPYEKNAHKKVRESGIWVAVPRGRKHFLWFRHLRGECVCIALELDRRRRGISRVKAFVCSFDRLLCSGEGTIMYGTLFPCSDLMLFSTEDLLFLRGRDVTGWPLAKRVQSLPRLLQQHTRQIAVGPHSLVVGMPITAPTREALRKSCEDLPYDLYAFQFRSSRRGAAVLTEKWSPAKEPRERMLMARACLEADIYALSDPGSGADKGFACIPNYQTSVFMNGLFRKIKENADLDALEESDSEEEFEDIRADKFVDLEKQLTLRCIYMARFKAWRPCIPGKDGAFKQRPRKKIAV